MTAVASPPSVQSGPRLGWYNSGNGGQGALSSVNADEVSRMFMPRKSVQRSNSASSLGSASSTTSITSAPSPNTNVGQNSNVESNTWSSKKKPTRSIWPNTKSEPVSGLSNARPQVVPAFSSGPSPSTMSAMHQPSNIVPSQHMLQTPQQNGVRPAAGPSGDPPAILTLVPINGTFERKQINVPYYPEVLRIGRQTNAKTVPTALNGYFDSKVLSRQHAEIWADKSGKVWIRDVKSSNGTFVNGQRLSPENRESEPHELRENDTLELGIDIVSEDQKTIVHHKVSSKVEHAGVYGSMPNILDLTLGDLDPASGGGLLPSPLSQPLSHMRGRSGSSASNRSAQSSASTQLNALQQQRQMNYWTSPISIEQVVKRLTSEMKQANKQSQDLRQTDEFLTTLMKPGHPEKEKIKPSPVENNIPRQMNGRPKMPRVDSFSRFSDPPAPPPQQPLPEKPDALPRSSSDTMSPLKRSDTEKPKPGAVSSPVLRDSSQILSLIEALSSAKRELDSQGTRVKELESLLLQERSARETAEEKTRILELQSKKTQELEIAAASEPSLDRPQENGIHKHDNEKPLILEEPALPQAIDSKEAEQGADPQAKRLQQRLDKMMEEMDEMRQQVSIFKDRAQKAEDETVETRKSLAEMIETLRQDRAEKGNKPGAHVSGTATSCEAFPSSKDDATHSKVKDSGMLPHDPVTSPQAPEVDDASQAFALQRRKLNALEQSSPYASMLGVVLLGVGIMAYLNGWQKMDK